jgi:hypothetical protein
MKKNPKDDIDPMQNRYEVMMQYQMSPLEAKSYKLSCLYNDLLKEMFPTYASYKTSKGDPRKTNIFKYCYKLAKETPLKDNELWMYVKAQFDIMKSLEKNGFMPLIQPNCLVGEKAWKRWLVWKKKYQQKLQQPKENILDIDKKFILSSLFHTKKFLEKRIGTLEKEKIIDLLDKNTLQLWISTQQVCGYFVVLCETLDSWLKSKNLEHSIFNLDFEQYKKNIDKEIINFYKENIGL